MLSSTDKMQIRKYCEQDSNLSHLFQELEDSYRMDVSQISHEIRNPVTLINSFLQLTESRYPEVRHYNTWPHIMENMNYLKQLLADLSSYQNSGNLHKKELSLTRLLSSITEESRSLIAPCSITFEKLSAIPSARFDEIRIREAILNLIRNAGEALGNQENGHIRLTLSFDGCNFKIRVSNNGPVIEAADLKRIFEPFVTTKTEGTGLGLAIVQQVTLAHHGQLFVTSSPVETCFTLELPYITVD